LADNSGDRAITQAIIAMSKTLGLTVVAEGVETQEQEAFLRGQSCDETQGYYFCVPVLPQQIFDLLRCERAELVHLAAPLEARCGKKILRKKIIKQ
jgi:EAL domain-containing protein (putative c-di-GMP-specific phosphodiesterase class I)